MNRRALGILLLLGLILRIAAAVNTKVINHDGARFTMSARAMLAGNIDAALNVEPRMPPLYPLLIVGLSKVTGDLGLAGVVISVPLRHAPRHSRLPDGAVDLGRPRRIPRGTRRRDSALNYPGVGRRLTEPLFRCVSFVGRVHLVRGRARQALASRARGSLRRTRR
jgi:hypothetical protein